MTAVPGCDLAYILSMQFTQSQTLYLHRPRALKATLSHSSPGVA